MVGADQREEPVPEIMDTSYIKLYIRHSYVRNVFKFIKTLFQELYNEKYYVTTLCPFVSFCCMYIVHVFCKYLARYHLHIQMISCAIFNFTI